MKIEITGNKAIAHGPLPPAFLQTVIRMSGRKKWSGTRSVTFDATRDNLEVIKNSGFNIEDNSEAYGVLDAMSAMARQTGPIDPLPKTKYKPATTPTKEQKEALALGWKREAYAYLLEMGLGKTWILISNIGMLWTEGEIVGAVIVAPSGVDQQWIDEEIPKHFDKRLLNKVIVQTTHKMNMKKWKFDGSRLNLLFSTTDGVRTNKGFEAIEAFSKACGGRALMGVDESHKFKTNPKTSQRTRALLMLGPMFKYRRILTGTPIGKSLEDLFWQFKFLDHRIFGYKYITAFRNKFCIMGGFKGKETVGYQNVEEFYDIIAPHSYRKTKVEAGVRPPALRQSIPYSMSKATRERYDLMREELIAEIDNGEIVTAANAMVGVLRLQQILSGFITHNPEDEAAPVVERFGSERAEMFCEWLSQISGPVGIWCRFHPEIEQLSRMIPDLVPDRNVSVYHGKMTKAARHQAKLEFVNGETNVFLATGSSGGTGLNLQGKCLDVAYFGHDFSTIIRRQSEDRFDRRGAAGAVTFWDVVARNSVDRRALARHKSNKALSALALDDIRQMLLEP